MKASTRSYPEMLAKLDGLGRFGMKLTLDRIEAILEMLGRPERRLRAVHVAGTNGKGSTVAMLDAILRAAGFRTGRYTSPHLVDYRERVALDGRPAPPEKLAAAFPRVWTAVERVKEGPAGHPTQFEVGTALAFLVLAEAGIDLAVIEVGLGGRYDTTNVLDPLAAVLTHVALDHTDRLGPDLPSIAAEKAGIIKPGRPVAIAPQEPEALRVILAEAARRRAPVRLVGRDLACELLRAGEEGTYCRLRGARDYGEVRVNLLGAHQAQNAAVAVAAVEALVEQGADIPMDAVQQGLAAVTWPGRLEVVRRTPRVVLDGAHNPDGLTALAAALRGVFRRDKVDFLVGITGDRPVAEMAGLLAPLARRVTVTAVNGGRAPGVDPGRIAAAFAGMEIPVETEPDPAAALDRALAGMPADGLLCVCGSLHLVGTIRGILQPEE
ncbi:MAG: bifunctional folylpolyglutamate synthase/dihydrofolate synthase [Bacteroidota bacterium]